ncbi:hypothetical protein DPMN_109637 [Dreissena polymorpha]|uniref:Uncharacterized protein n=1 Tax=Dreissena polymorpha TaxID=45954 RepID=A0A9D4QN48_DREPO|nr:hypothetical protein DPMN_109637 [Dreissena polymorpha]
MYLLKRLLSDEANIAPRNVQLVIELQLTGYKRRQQTTMQGQIARLWSLYRRGEVSADNNARPDCQVVVLVQAR